MKGINLPACRTHFANQLLARYHRFANGDHFFWNDSSKPSGNQRFSIAMLGNHFGYVQSNRKRLQTKRECVRSKHVILYQHIPAKLRYFSSTRQDRICPLKTHVDAEGGSFGGLRFGECENDKKLLQTKTKNIYIYIDCIDKLYIYSFILYLYIYCSKCDAFILRILGTCQSSMGIFDLVLLTKNT
jgi:hypothetical protein